MSAQQIFRLRNPVLLMALAAVFPVLSHAAGAANIDFASGSVTAVNALGVQRPLTKGAEISNGDTIRTGGGGRAQVRFSDGAMVSLQPQTDFRIDNYQYSGKADGQEKGFFSLLKGGLRTITGLVGRSSRDNYKVTTGVATIGIRGTEYSAALDASGSELVVNTGEGLVEVCNAAGCMLLASGESGIVTGSRTPSRTDSRPRLDPAQPENSSLPDYSKSEDRQANGTVMPVSMPLVSGSQNYVSYAGWQNSSAVIGLVTAGSVASFDTASNLNSFSDSGAGFSYAVKELAGSFSMDGVIGWGRWATGDASPTGYGSPEALKDIHYVTGVPTTAAQITGLTMTGTYLLAGYTLPTSSTGLVGTAPSGVLTASFSGGTISNIKADINVPIGGSTFNLFSKVGFGTNGGGGNPAFTISSGSDYVKGFFAGTNASHAGLTYQFDGGGSIGKVSGAAAFKR
jgi:hypothetical protein